MLYLLDANTLIDAKNFYWQMERVPEFWEWLEYQGNEGRIKIPQEIYDELDGGNREVVPVFRTTPLGVIFHDIRPFLAA
jgi:hypothetical protein